MGKDKILQLQGLRGLAILGIFVFHTKTFISEDSGVTNNFLIMQLGTIGVIIFFMLSGFLLIYKMKTIPRLTWKERINASWAKFHKLYLLYILTLIFAFFGKTIFPKNMADWFFTLISLPFNLTYTQDLIPLVRINISFNGPAWYISAMFIIWIIVYCFPTKINQIKNSNIKTCSICILAIIGIQIIYKIIEYSFPTNLIPINHSDIYMSWISYYSPFYNFGFFIMGCFIGRLAILNRGFSINWIYITFIIILILFSTYIFFHNNYFKFAKSILFEILISILLLRIMSSKSLLGRLFSIKPLVWLGNISASFFLIHGVVNYNLRYIEGSIDKPQLFIVSLCVTIILSILSEKYLILKKDESILQRIRKIA